MSTPPGFLRDTGWSLLASVLSGPLVLLGVVVTARWLPPDAHGQLQAVLSLLALIATIGNGGLVAATIQRMRGADTPPAEAVGAGLVGVTAFSALLIGGFVVGEPWLRGHVLLDVPMLAYLALAALIAPTLWGSILGAVARGLGRFDWWSRAELSDRAGRLLVFVGLWVGWPANIAMAVIAVLAVHIGVVVGLAGRVLGATGRPVAPSTRPARPTTTPMWTASTAITAMAMLAGQPTHRPTKTSRRPARSESSARDHQSKRPSPRATAPRIEPHRVGAIKAARAR